MKISFTGLQNGERVRWDGSKNGLLKETTRYFSRGQNDPWILLVFDVIRISKEQDNVGRRQISYPIKIIKLLRRHSRGLIRLNITKTIKIHSLSNTVVQSLRLVGKCLTYDAANPQHVRYKPILREIQRIQLQKSSPVIKLSWEQLLLPVPPSVVILVKSLPQHPPSLQYCRGTYDCIIEASYPSPPTHPP